MLEFFLSRVGLSIVNKDVPQIFEDVRLIE
jgi:hypothetical protein